MLAACGGAGVIPADEAQRAKGERMPTARREFPMLAPHLADTAVEQTKSRLVHRLTIDAAAQANLEQLTREHTAALGGRLSAAVIVVDHRTGEVVAHVGSPGLPGRIPLRRRRHDGGRALAGLDPEADHLRSRLRGWASPIPTR